MSVRTPITFVVPVKSKGPVLENNFLSSPCFSGNQSYKMLIQENFSSAGNAYNDALRQVDGGVIVFVHQDIILPAHWISDLEQSLEWLEHEDPNWGVLGCGGMGHDGQGRGHIYSSGVGLLGRPFSHPVEVRVLDEIVLILRKTCGLRFDETLPYFHFYGTDICLRAAREGMKNYVIPAFCIHNTYQNLILPEEFYACYRHIKRSWSESLPIQTTCIQVTRYDLPRHIRRLKEKYLRHLRHKEFGGTRAEDTAQLLRQVDALRQSV